MFRSTHLLPLLLLATLAAAPATQPLAPDPALEFHATQAFNRGDYAIALPLLQKLTTQFHDQPQLLGPVLERVRVCRRNLTQPPPTSQPASTDGPPPDQECQPHAPPEPGQVLDITIKDLGNFRYDPRHPGHLPPDLLRLDGATLRLHGFMIPMTQADTITQFALVPSLFACCYGQPPQVQHTVLVNCPPGKVIRYFPDELSVEGRLKVQEKTDEGFVVSLFELDATSVKPK